MPAPIHPPNRVQWILSYPNNTVVQSLDDANNAIRSHLQETSPGSTHHVFLSDLSEHLFRNPRRIASLRAETLTSASALDARAKAQYLTVAHESCFGGQQSLTNPELQHINQTINTHKLQSLSRALYASADGAQAGAPKAGAQARFQAKAGAARK